MNIKKILLLSVLIVLLFSCNVKGFNEDANNKTNQDNKKVEELYNYITNINSQYEFLKDIDVKDYVKHYMQKGESKLSGKKLIKHFITYAFREVHASLKLMAILIIIAVICALLTNLQKAFSNESLSNIAYFACYSLIIIIMTKSFYIGVKIANESINKMTDFMAALIPVLIMLVASVGGFVEAAILDPIIIGAINISSQIFVKIIIPIIIITFVLQFANNISSDYKVDKLTKLLNQIALWSQGIIMTVFIGIITIRGISSQTIDEVTSRTAKFAVDNFVPIVGKCLSDAIGTVAGYSMLLKNAISSLGLFMLVIMISFPLIKILAMVLMYKLTAALIEPISDGRLVNCISSAGDSLILIMSCLICVCVMFFIMIAIIASAGRLMIGV
jgi:stage III sporulation protein AE